MNAGSVCAILYEVCHVIDEMFHAIPFFPEAWEFRFCQWAHRYDWQEIDQEDDND